MLGRFRYNPELTFDRQGLERNYYYLQVDHESDSLGWPLLSRRCMRISMGIRRRCQREFSRCVGFSEQWCFKYPESSTRAYGYRSDIFRPRTTVGARHHVKRWRGRRTYFYWREGSSSLSSIWRLIISYFFNHDALCSPWNSLPYMGCLQLLIDGALPFITLNLKLRSNFKNTVWAVN